MVHILYQFILNIIGKNYLSSDLRQRADDQAHNEITSTWNISFLSDCLLGEETKKTECIVLILLTNWFLIWLSKQ